MSGRRIYQLYIHPFSESETTKFSCFRDRLCLKVTLSSPVNVSLFLLFQMPFFLFVHIMTQILGFLYFIYEAIFLKN